MHKKRDILQFWKALAVACWFSLVTWNHPHRRLIGALTLLWSPKCNLNLLARRMECCKECPLFYRPLQTCGSPLKDGPGPDLGCFCHCPTKNHLLYARCWLADRPGGFGWPKTLLYEP